MKLRVNLGGETQELAVPTGARLLDYIQGAELPINAACGGGGTCHKCRVRVVDGFLPVTAKDQIAFKPSELEQGWRLSCQSRPRVNAEIEIPMLESLRGKPRLVRNGTIARDADVRLVCDLGSTGVVVALSVAASVTASAQAAVSVSVQHTVDGPQAKSRTASTTDAVSVPSSIEAHLLNKQIRFGADVMTRLHQAQKLGVEPLRAAVLETLKACLLSLKEAEPEVYARALPHGLTCAGNSAMTSFLLNQDTATLAVAPFQPKSLAAGEMVWSEMDGLVVRTLPLLAGFVGGDTVAGLLAVDAQAKALGPNAAWALVDIGTNTEIVINNGRGELWLSSAPAGPAFEGGNISQGMRAESGAISVAHWRDGRWELKTIGGDRPRGICGSGLIDILHEAVQAGLITRDGFVETGRLEVTPEIGLLADDVREFQLAKSATRTATDLLVERAGAKPRVIYLAGTFAQNLRQDSLAGVGLLPEGVPVQIVGNASLAGVSRYAAMTGSERKSFVAGLESASRPVELALQDDFQERFVRNLNF